MLLKADAVLDERLVCMKAHQTLVQFYVGVKLGTSAFDSGARHTQPFGGARKRFFQKSKIITSKRSNEQVGAVHIVLIFSFKNKHLEDELFPIIDIHVPSPELNPTHGSKLPIRATFVVFSSRGPHTRLRMLATHYCERLRGSGRGWTSYFLIKKKGRSVRVRWRIYRTRMVAASADKLSEKWLPQARQGKAPRK